MEKLTLREMAEAAGGKLIRGRDDVVISGVSTDSRNICRDELFIALIGPNHDAHKFLGGAYDLGCRAVMVSDKEKAMELPEDCSIILVENTTYGLQELAKWYLNRMDMRKVAVTGSVGKTTTRDMIYSCLARKYNTGTCKHNFNNQVGLPLAILDLRENMQVAVLEMAMEDKNHIGRLAEIAPPDVAVITNIGISHIEKLGSRENIFKEKMEVARFFNENNVLVINADDDCLSTLSDEDVAYKIVRAGLNEEADFYASDVEDLGSGGIRFNLNCYQGSFPIRLMVPGAHNAVNAAMAAAVCSVMGVAIEDIMTGLAQVEMTDNRLKLSTINGVSIINDTYNAAPESMKSILTTLSKSEGRRKIAVLGPMNELGELTEESHIEVGRFAGEKDINILFTLGELGKLIGDEAHKTNGAMDVRTFAGRDDLIADLKKTVRPGDVIIFKASRTIELEKAAEELESYLSEQSRQAESEVR